MLRYCSYFELVLHSSLERVGDEEPAGGGKDGQQDVSV